MIGCSHNFGEIHFIELREYYIGYPQNDILLKEQVDIEKYKELHKFFQTKKDVVAKYLTQIKFLIFKQPYSREFVSSRTKFT
jgi:hypothetical protein